MNRFLISPAARLLVSFALVIGILVAGLTKPFSPITAEAQTESEAVSTLSVGIGTFLPISRGEVVGTSIGASGLLVNGVPVDVAFSDKLRIIDSMVFSNSFMTINGVVTGGQIDGPKDGVVTGGQAVETVPVEDAPVIMGTGVETQDVVVSADEGVLNLAGGELLGDNIRVVDGVVYGDNLRVVGATVTGSGLSVSGVFVMIPGY